MLHIGTRALTCAAGLAGAFAFCLVVSAVQADDFAEKAQQNWHQWRGPNGDGSALNSNPPTEWSDTKNIKWKVPVPGKGSSSPIVWEDKIYVMTAIDTGRQGPAATETVGESELTAQAEAVSGSATETAQRSNAGRQRATPPTRAAQGVQERGQRQDRQDLERRQDRGQRQGGRQGRGGGRGQQAPLNLHQFAVVCFDRETGRQLWQKVLVEAVPHESGHGTNTFSSASPIVDGQRIFANFGSRGFFCLDMEGNVLWQKDLGQMSTRNNFGEGSSASVYENTVVVPWDHEGDSFICALDATTGDEKWRMPRREQTTWATPLITKFNDRVQVVTNGSSVRSYDLETGELIWEYGGMTQNPIPSPIRHEDNVILMTGHRGFAIVSLTLDSMGDVTASEKVNWTDGGAAPYVPSPVLYDGVLYFNKSNNPLILARDVKTGEIVLDETRIPQTRVVYASPVAAGGHVYFCSREGTTVVFKSGSSGQVVAINELGETIDASPAIVGDEMFIRGEQHLYCIAE